MPPARCHARKPAFNLDTPMGRKALEGMRPGWPKVLESLELALAA
jgi:hypothetical protein